MSVYQWTGSSNADLANEGNWVNTSNPGTIGTPGLSDVAIIEVGQGLYGVIDVDALDIVQASGAPTISITGSSTQVTAGSVGIGYGFTLDDGAYLQAGALGIDGDGTSVTVQNNAYLYDSATAENDVLDIGAGSGTASVLVTKGGSFTYSSNEATGALNVGGTLNSVATLTISADGYFSSVLNSLNIGGAAGSTGYLDVTGPGSQFLVDNYGYTTIGDFGELGGSAQGTVSVTNGGYASLSSYGEVDIGTSAGMAKVLVSGANSAIEAGPYTEVGEYGTNIAGEILVQSGGEFDNATDVYLNNGTISVTGAKSLFTARILTADNGATVSVGLGSLIHVTDVQLGGKLTLNGGGVNTRADFASYGGSEIIGHGAITAATLANAGRLVASNGTLAVSSSITGTGAEVIDAGATLQLDDGVVGSQTVTFAGADGVLELGSATAFKGKINKFAAGETLDLGSVAYVSGASAVVSGSTLVVKDGTATYDFKLRGATASSYRVVKDSGGGTEIVASGAAAARTLLDAAAAFGAQGADLATVTPLAAHTSTLVTAFVESARLHRA